MATADRRVLPGFSLTLGYTVTYLGLLVILPIAACFTKAFSLSFDEFALQWKQTEKEREAVLAYTGTDGREIHWDLIRLTFMSVARLAVVPLQDVLGLGTEARMNTPGTESGNWEWRYDPTDLTSDVAKRLRRLTETYERART